MKLLIVDDSPADRELIRRKLRQAFDDVAFVEVGSKRDFAEALSGTDYDMVLTDYYLHWGDGLEVFQAVRARDPDVPVVMFTDSGNEEVAVAGLKMGLSDYLRKHDLNRLPVAVADSLERTRLRQKYEEAERQLRRSEARFRAIFEYAALGIALVGPDRTYLTVNPAFADMLGYPVEALVGRPFLEFAHPDDVEEETALYEQLLAQDIAVYQTENRYLHRDGSTIWARSTTSQTENPVGERQLVVAMVEDITEQRAAQEALIRAEKMTLTGTLAASIAHEINNPMQTVIGCLGLAMESLHEDGDPDDTQCLLQMATDELRRASNIVSGLRDLNRRSRPEDRRLTKVDDLLDRVLTLSAGELKAGQVEARREIARGLPSVMVVPDRLHQVLLNLILNASHAMPDGGVITIAAEKTDSPQGVRLTVADTGVGIPEEIQADLFSPFITTKQDGVGLGLYVSRNIVEEHGGTIGVESEVGEGTAVHVWLPT